MSANLDLPDLFGKPPRPSQRRNVRFPVNSRPCRWCNGGIVWVETPTGARMPLSWKSRLDWIEGGKRIGFSMEPHFADCPNWPGRSKKK